MIVPLDALEHASHETCGSKAWMLSLALRRGYRVPAGIVAPTPECEGVLAHWRAEHAMLLARLLGEASPDDCVNHPEARDLTLPRAFEHELGSAVRALKAETGSASLIVRSSATAEDTGASSHAGQFYSEADVVSEEETQLAVSRVLLTYLWRRERSLAAGGIAVILQVQAASDLSGVAFSCNPVTGDPDEMVIAYRQGDCGRVTDGAAPARQVSIRLGQTEADESCIHKDGTTADMQTCDVAVRPFAHEIVRTLTGCEELLDSPADIEWAVAQGDFYLLQARPVTKVAFWQGALDDLPLEAEQYERCTAGPIHRNSWHWLEVGDRAHAEVFPRFGEDHLQVTHRVINGYVYRSIRVDRSRYDVARQRQLVLTEGPTALARWTEEKGRLLRELRRLNRASVSLLPLRELKARYQSVVGLAARAQRAHDTLQRPIGISARWVQELAERLAGYDEMRSISLLDEPCPLETEFGERLGALSIDADAKPVPDDQFQEIVHDFGYMFTSFDELYSPLSWETWEEDNTPLRLLCLAHQQGTSKSDGDTHRRRVLEARRTLLARAQGADPEAAALLRRVLDLAVRSMAVRVDKDLCLSLAFAVHRKYLSELGVRVFGQEAYRRIFAATVDEVLEFCASGRKAFLPGPRAAIEQRCRHHRVFQKMPAPDALPAGPAMAADPGDQQPGAEVRDVIEGAPGAAGTATGPVRVLRDIRDIAALKPGEVMVIPDIKPAWALAFGMASGIISADGHLLAHGAIMAREAGIPLVYVGEDMNCLRTGDQVRVLGDQGRVEVLSVAT